MPFIGHKIECTTDHFGNIIREGGIFVDKSLMIKEFWNGQKVSLITRPRRFGKSLNLSMLQHFFADTVAKQKTAGLFDHLAIATEDDGQWMAYQGQYPVILISFKDIKEPSYELAIEKIRDLIKQTYREHLNAYEHIEHPAYKQLFDEYVSGRTSSTSLESALSFLTECLFEAWSKKTIVLIDEYDTPLTHAYQHGFLAEMSHFLRNMFSAALKSNAYLEKGLITGILRVSKNELLSGLNNLQVYTLFDEKYSQCFGFTEQEVMELIQHLNITPRLEEIKAFYNGYMMGDETTIYNPWSLMNYFSKKELVPYWVLTAGDALLKRLFLEANTQTKKQLAVLMQGESVQGHISLKTSYEELMENSDALWTLLLFAGYLTSVHTTLRMNHAVCQLKIPNREIHSQYEEIFNAWLTKNMGEVRYQRFITTLLNGDVPQFTRLLSEYLMDALSFRDVVGDKKAENFYHGFVAALIASVRDTHWVDSNKESGEGLYDILLTPKDSQHTRGIILEFKHAKRQENIEKAAEIALMQIDTSRYATVLARYPHVTQILSVGLAFSGKEAQSAYKESNLITHQETRVYWTTPCLREELLLTK